MRSINKDSFLFYTSKSKYLKTVLISKYIKSLTKALVISCQENNWVNKYKIEKKSNEDRVLVFGSINKIFLERIIII